MDGLCLLVLAVIIPWGSIPNTRRKMYSYDAFASPEDSKSIQGRYGTGKGYIVRGPEFVPLLP
jgi:hypothetical protein